jgi:hypothetical protein
LVLGENKVKEPVRLEQGGKPKGKGAHQSSTKKNDKRHRKGRTSETKGKWAYGVGELPGQNAEILERKGAVWCLGDQVLVCEVVTRIAGRKSRGT